MKWRNKKVVVTGATGFIGTNLVNRLRTLGAKVETIEGNLCDARYMAVLEHINPEYIFHLASNVGGIDYLLTNMYQIALDNITMSLNVINAAKKCTNLKGFLFPSSACVYPKEGGIGLVEESAYPANPHSDYGWGKLYTERLIKFSGLPAVCLRLANVYGPHEHFNPPTHVIPSMMVKMIKSAQMNEPTIRIFGDGNQGREFIYVDDVIDAMLLAIREITNSAVLNVGTGQEHTIKEVIEKLTTVIGVEPRIICDSEKPTGEPHRSFCVKKAKMMLNWETQVSLDEGLQKTYDWVKKNVKDLFSPPESK